MIPVTESVATPTQEEIEETESRRLQAERELEESRRLVAELKTRELEKKAKALEAALAAEGQTLATVTTTTVTTTVEGEEPVTTTTVSAASPIANPLETLGPVAESSTSPTQRRTTKRERSSSIEVQESSIPESMAVDVEEEQELEEGRKIATNRRAAAAEALARERAGPLQTFKQAVWGAAVFGVGVGVT